MTMRLLSAILMATLLWVGGVARAAAQAEDCSGGPEWDAAASSNAITVHSLEWSPFNRVELGWETYLPLIQQELGTRCAPSSGAFAAQLAAFQTRYALPGTGLFDQATFQVFRGLWQERRPFILARVRGECPEPPPIAQLGYLVASEEHADRLTRLLRRDVLHAYRRMVAAARAEVPEIAADPELLQIFSGFRDPEADAARCAREGNCDGVARATCSAHRTGTAVDLYVGHMDGMGVDSLDAAARRHQTQGPAYRWLVANAGRFGFVPYVFEPWHWEWIGVTPETADGSP